MINHKGTVWTLMCPCGRVHERKRRVVSTDIANELEKLLAELVEAATVIVNGDVTGDAVRRLELAVNKVKRREREH